jgi:hypothetical protein
MPITALTELETVEVSLVPAGANLKKRFPIMKRNEDSSMSDILHAVIDAQTSEDSHFENVVKSADLSEEAALAVKGAMKILNAYADTIPADQALSVIGKGLGVSQNDQPVAKQDEEEDEEKEEVQSLAEMITEAEEEGADKGDDEEHKKEDEEEHKKEDEEEHKKEDEEAEKGDDVEKPYHYKEDEDDKMKKSALQKSLKDLDPAVRNQIQALWKSQAQAVAKAEKLEKSLMAERDEKQRKEFIEKARKEYRFVPGKSPDELGLMLKALHSLDSQIAKDIEGIFKSVSAMMEKGDLLGEIGSSMTGEVSDGTAFSKLDNLAKSAVKKSGGSYATRFEEAMRSNPDLYTAYLTEQAK